MSKKEINDIVIKCWHQQYLGYSMTTKEKIRVCRKEISAWKRNNLTNSAKRIKELKSNIDQTHTDPATTMEQIHIMRKELAREYWNEEIFWHQKSRNQWLNHGDRNTRFFHAVTKNRIARNKLSSIQKINDETIYGNQRISEEEDNYFKNLFSSSKTNNMEKVLSYINHVVTPLMNEVLIRTVSPEEKRIAVFSIGAKRAPGPDGLLGLLRSGRTNYHRGSRTIFQNRCIS